MTSLRWALLLLFLVGVSASRVSADDEALRARLDALGTIAEPEADLARAARAALERASADRSRGDEPAAARAERIAEATIGLIERRRARAGAEQRRRVAERERDALRARVEQARGAAASDARERERLDPARTTP